MVKGKRTIFVSLFVLTVLGICILSPVTAQAADAESARADGVLIAGGMPFGMKINVGGCIVAGTDSVGDRRSPAAEAGLRRGDIITRVGETKVSSTRELIRAVSSGGDEIVITFIRAGKERSVTVRPIKDGDGKGKIGILVRDSAAGIGTVTFIEPKTLMFAGLGHGICDAESGTVLPVTYGSVERIDVTGITPGRPGAPGELRGVFVGKRMGKILKNDKTGVYGELYELPEYADALYPVASLNEITDGKAYIRSAVSGAPELYEIELTKIGGGEQKNFSVKVTDERLLALTGGIVQGMSGSPIIQNGKLVGAVTHVLVTDPTAGYGIFIGNMISGMIMTDVFEDSAA